MLLGFLLGILLTLIVAVLLPPFIPDVPFLLEVQSNITNIQAFGSLAIAASAIVAFSVYRSNTRRQADEDERIASRTYLDESITLLERAYSILTRSGSLTNPPPNDRLLWLSAARMLIRFQKMKGKISLQEHTEIGSEHEEYWRLQFYSLLDDNNDNFTVSYFQPSGDLYGGDTVSRGSIAVIFGFARWREDESDPMDETNDRELIANGAIPIHFTGVVTFLQQYETYWAEIQNLRSQRDSGS